MTCGCLEHHWQEVAAVIFMGIGIMVPTYYIFMKLVKVQKDKIRRNKLLKTKWENKDEFNYFVGEMK